MESKTFNKRYIRVLSRHPSHRILRKPIKGRVDERKGVLVPALACIRLGSTTNWDKTGIQINSIESIQNSSSKLKMKNCFKAAEVETPEWWKNIAEVNNIEDIPFPIIAKKVFGSRGRGIRKIDNQNQWEEFLEENNEGYYFEKYYNYTREYRLHITEDGCFYTCRKMLKEGTPEHRKFVRNDSNCVWFLEDNEQFDKPFNWDSIVEHCVKSLKAVGLDIGACDVRVKGKAEEDRTHKFKVIEINSAPSFGEQTGIEWRKIIPSIIIKKMNNE